MRYWGATLCDDKFLDFTWINYIHEFEARFKDMLRGNNLHDILYMVSKLLLYPDIWISSFSFLRNNQNIKKDVIEGEYY